MRNVLMPMTSLMVNGVYRFASLWKIERTDGVVLRFTDHNRNIEYEGETYQPTNGAITTTAVQNKDGLDPPNIDIRGAISSDAITADDLRAGLYRGAVITEVIVDWMQPWAGKFTIEKFDALDTTHDVGEVWSAKLESILGRLKRRVGHTYTKGCRWGRLGDDDCGVNLGSLSQFCTVDVVTKTRMAFTSDASSVDGYFTDGYVEWAPGAGNENLKHEVKIFTAIGGVVELQIKTPYDINSGDQFLIFPGCDRSVDICKTKFNNISNFGGFPFIAGTDSMLSTPTKGSG